MLTRKIKVLHIITHLGLGGAQKVCLNLIKGLNREIFEIHFITSPSGRLVKALETIPGIEIVLIPALKREINLIGDLHTLIKLFNYISKHQFDIVHTHSPKAGILGRWAARLASTPIIIHTIHGFPFYAKQNYFSKKLYIFIESLTARITTKLIAVCEGDIEKGSFAGIGDRTKYILIREGIEIDRKRIGERRITKSELGISESSFLVGMVASLKPQKLPLDFVRAAALIKERLPETNFVLIGDGYLRKKVENLVEKLRLKSNFSILGWREDALEIISLFDVFVLTSVWEGLPIVLLEAMYMDKPIVATAVDGVKELISDGENGFLVKAGDYRNLAQRTVKLLENASLRDLFVSRNRINILRRFDISLMVKQTEALYLNLGEGKAYVN